MHSHIDQDDLITEILIKIAYEKDKSLEAIKKLLLIKQDTLIINDSGKFSMNHSRDTATTMLAAVLNVVY